MNLAIGIAFPLLAALTTVAGAAITPGTLEGDLRAAAETRPPHLHLAQLPGQRQTPGNAQNSGQTRQFVRDGCVWMQIVRNGQVRNVKVSCQNQGQQQQQGRSKFRR